MSAFGELFLFLIGFFIVFFGLVYLSQKIGLEAKKHYKEIKRDRERLKNKEQFKQYNYYD